jgi:hypothetical protein
MSQLDLFDDYSLDQSGYYLEKAKSLFPPKSEFEEKLWREALCDFYNSRKSSSRPTPCDACQRPAAKTFVNNRDIAHACLDCLKKYHLAIDEFEKGLRQYGKKPGIWRPTWYQFSKKVGPA